MSLSTSSNSLSLCTLKFQQCHWLLLGLLASITYIGTCFISLASPVLDAYLHFICGRHDHNYHLLYAAVVLIIAFCVDYESAVFVMSSHSLNGMCLWLEICQTGPKGVVEDWRRYKQLEVEKREEQAKEKELLAKRLAVTCRSQVIWSTVQLMTSFQFWCLCGNILFNSMWHF